MYRKHGTFCSSNQMQQHDAKCIQVLMINQNQKLYLDSLGYYLLDFLELLMVVMDQDFEKSLVLHRGFVLVMPVFFYQNENSELTLGTSLTHDNSGHKQTNDHYTICLKITTCQQ